MSNYWTATAPRVPWDRDGSVLNYWPTTNVITRLPQSAMTWLNSESADNSGTTQQLQWNTGGTIAAFTGLAVLFPFPRDMAALFSFGNTHPPSTTPVWQCSHDTTNGLDGTWVTVSGLVDSPFVKPYYRVAGNVIVLTQNADTQSVRGVRLFWPSVNGFSSSYVRAMHLYGYPSSSATSERIEFWHPTSDVVLPAGWLDYADFARGTTADKAFRIKNLSPDKTANAVLMQVEVLSDTTPPVVSQFTIGDPSSVFATTQTVPSLAPGAVSGVYTLRRVTPTTAQLSTWTARLDTNVASWT